MTPQEKDLVTHYRSMDDQQRAAYLTQLTMDELEVFYQVPEARLYPKQDAPEGDWRYCLFRCGRGFGKSVAGAGWLARKVRDGAKSIALYGPTYSEVTKVMVPALLSFFPPGHASFNAGSNTILFPNGCICYCYSSEKENRGPNLEYLWTDEICIHADGIPEKIQMHFDVIDMTVRVGKNPQTLITSTPKPHMWFIKFDEMVRKNPDRYVIKTGTMWDNPFLPQSFIDAQIEKHGGTRLGRQELHGDLLEASEGALWSKDMLDATRMDTKSRDALLMMMVRIVVGVDPAVTDSSKADETGIVVCGMDDKNRVWVLEDLSGTYSPNAWAIKVAEAAKDWQADCMVAEANNGGQLVETNIRTVDRRTRVKLVHAKKGKMLRAEPVAALWEQKKAGMVGSRMVKLENQMCTFDGNPKMSSPDRLDALVYAVSELSLNKVYVSRDLTGLPYV